MTKFLVGIKYFGEQEFHDCIKALYQQSEDFDWFLVQNQPNKLAHQLVYANFEKHRENYLGCVMLDADMVMQNNQILAKARTKIAPDDVSKHVILVHDFLGNITIPGLNIFKANYQFYDHDDRLIPDIDSQHDGRIVVDYGENNIASVHHMPNPNLYQAYRYGVQRAMKIMQLDRQSPARTVQMVEWTILSSVFHAHKYMPNIARAYAIKGAMDFVMVPKDIQMQYYLHGDYAGQATKDRLKQIEREAFDLSNFDLNLLINSPVIYAVNIMERATTPFEDSREKNKKIPAKLFDFANFSLPEIFAKSSLLKLLPS